MWQPKYIIRPKLLRVIREIGETLGALRTQRLSDPNRARLTLEARALSSFASTSIEGNPLPLTDVKWILKRAPPQLRDTEREILNYNRALEWVENSVRGGEFLLSAKTFAAVQGRVVAGLMDNKFDVGRLRQRPVVIRDPHTPDGVMFMPPDYKDIPKLLDELMQFVATNQHELDPILLAGIFHKQSVIIHPFMDGNGRSTRLMTTAILGLEGLDIFPIFSFENYYNQNISRYFQRVGERGDFYDTGGVFDFTDWLEYFAEGILDELKRVQKNLPEPHPRLEPHLQTVLDYLAKHGSMTQREYAKISNRSLAARKKDCTRLIELGLIRKIGGGRSTHYELTNNSSEVSE